MKIIVVDTSYNLNEFYKRGSLNVITARDLSNYFKNVYNVHPLSDLTNEKLVLNKSFYNYKKLNSTHSFYQFISGKNKKLFFFNLIFFVFFQLKMIFFLSKLIKEYKINFIKAGDCLYAGLIGLILSKLTNRKLIIRIGSNNDKIRFETQRPIQKKFFRYIVVERFFEKLVIKNSYHILPANINNGLYANSLYPCLNKSTVIRYGPLINDCHFQLPYKRIINNNLISENFNNNFKIIVCVSRLEKEKLVNHAIEVFSKLLDIDQYLKLFIVGDGSQKQMLENLVKIKNIKDKVFFTGDKDQLWISELFTLSSLVLSPHTGRALCEAALAGTNVVGYNIDWQSEIIENNYNGYLVDYKDIESLYKVAKK